MKKLFVIFSFGLLFIFSIKSNTFFLYSEEHCDDQKVLLEESAREGLMNVIFDDGYIIFDDISTKEVQIPTLLDAASGYGAYFLIVMYIQSRQTLVNEKPEKLISQARYTLYDLKNKKAVGSGNIDREIDFAKSPVSRTQFWYNLGADIGKDVEKIYLQYVQ